MLPKQSSSSNIIGYLKETTPDFDSEYELLDLIEKMLRLNPTSRFTAEECLQHEFFKLGYEQYEPHTPLMTEAFLEKRRADK